MVNLSLKGMSNMRVKCLADLSKKELIIDNELFLIFKSIRIVNASGLISRFKSLSANENIAIFIKNSSSFSAQEISEFFNNVFQICKNILPDECFEKQGGYKHGRGALIPSDKVSKE